MSTLVADGSITFTYDADRGVRYATYDGNIDDHVLIEAYRALITDPAFVPRAHDIASTFLPKQVSVYRSMEEAEAWVASLPKP